MSNFFRQIAIRFIDWCLRRRSMPFHLITGGLALVGLVFAGAAFSISVPTTVGPFAVTFDTKGGPSALLTALIFCLGVALIVVGLTLYWRDQRLAQRKKVLVLEVRGLRDSPGSALCDSVPDEIEGVRQQILIDLRQRVQDGLIVNPVSAVQRIVTLPHDLESHRGGLDRSDITIVYGGLCPVPLTFLTGVMMDDEEATVVMDWNRHSGKWQPLDQPDDGKRFAITGLSDVSAGTQEVAVAVSVSYRVDLEGVKSRVAGKPLVHLELENGSVDCHWSEEKQVALGVQFLETMITLANKGVKRVDIFLAAQNSIAFRFGRLYDKRNLPEAIVFQYERHREKPYPWGVFLPVSGRTAGIIE
jgi:hypothetical protein